MANVVEVVVKGTDQSGAAFKTATGNMKAMSREMKVLNTAFSQGSNIAQSFGSGPLATVLSSLQGATIASRQLTQELGKSKAAMAALAITGLGLGAALADPVYELFAGKDTTADTRKGYELLSKTLSSQLALKDQSQAREIEINAVITDQIRLAKALNIEEKLRNELITATYKLGSAQLDQSRAGQSGDMQRLWQDLYARQGVALKNTDGGLPTIGGDGVAVTEGTTYDSPEQAKQVVAFQQQLDAMLQSFQTYTNDKEQISAFAAQVEATRAAGLKDLQIKFDQEAAQKRIQIQQSLLGAMGGLFGALAGLAQTFGKKGFLAYQAFSIAQAIISTAAGVSRALADHPWPFSNIVAGIVAATGAVQIATIAATKPAGQAHSGLDNVPRTGTYTLEQGEAVIRRNENERLSRFLDRADSGGGGGGRMMSVSFHLDGTLLARALGEMSRDGRLILDGRSIA